MMEKMKPCPFCGSDNAKTGYYDGYVPYCDNPECPIWGKNPCPYPNEAEAIAAWNTRPREREWISVEDRLPEDLQPVLVKGEADNHIRKGFDVCWRYDGSWPSWHVRNVTHWQPLPQPPEREEE